MGKLVNWWAFNNGFHGIHHEVPGLHWSLTPQAHAEYFGAHIHPELEQKSMLVYVLKAFVYPGVRRTFEGQRVELPPAERDEPWIPRPEETPEDLGAIAPG